MDQRGALNGEFRGSAPPILFGLAYKPISLRFLSYSARSISPRARRRLRTSIAVGGRAPDAQSATQTIIAANPMKMISATIRCMRPPCLSGPFEHPQSSFALLDAQGHAPLMMWVAEKPTSFAAAGIDKNLAHRERPLHIVGMFWQQD
jgi:hypothetical protein